MRPAAKRKAATTKTTRGKEPMRAKEVALAEWAMHCCWRKRNTSLRADYMVLQRLLPSQSNVCTYTISPLPFGQSNDRVYFWRRHLFNQAAGPMDLNLVDLSR